jgi:hypothetical protein
MCIFFFATAFWLMLTRRASELEIEGCLVITKNQHCWQDQNGSPCQNIYIIYILYIYYIYYIYSIYIVYIVFYCIVTYTQSFSPKSWIDVYGENRLGNLKSSLRQKKQSLDFLPFQLTNPLTYYVHLVNQPSMVWIPNTQLSLVHRLLCLNKIWEEESWEHSNRLSDLVSWSKYQLVVLWVEKCLQPWLPVLE